MRKGAVLFAASLLCLLIAAQKLPSNSSFGAKDELGPYLKVHWMPPEDYVVSKFQNHDIVFIGEWHRVRHDPLLIQALIRRIYQAGIHNLGMEFADHTDQPHGERGLCQDRVARLHHLSAQSLADQAVV